MFSLSESFHRVPEELESVSGRVPTGNRRHAQARVIRGGLIHQCVGKE